MPKVLHSLRKETYGEGHERTHIFHGIGLSAFFVFSGFVIWTLPIFLSGSIQIAYLASVPIIFLFSSIAVRNTDHAKKYFQILFAFFIASFANSISYNFGGGATIDGKVVNVVISASLIVLSILILNKLAGNDLGSIYIRKGRVVIGLIIGCVIFLSFLLTSVLAGTYLFGGQDLSFGRLIAWAPFIFTFVFVNALREELWFRGLFLKKYESLIGVNPAILVQAVVFSFAHVSTQFSLFAIFYMLVTFFLGLGFGVVMQKNEQHFGICIVSCWIGHTSNSCRVLSCLGLSYW